MIQHPDGYVGNVGFVAILRLPTSIEEFSIYLHLLRSEFVCYLVPAFHTVLIGPEPHRSPLVYERLHGFYLQELQTATSQPQLTVGHTEIVRHDECGLLALHHVHAGIGIGFQQVGAEQRFQDGMIIGSADVAVAFLVVEPTWVSLLVSVTVGMVTHQLGRSWYSLMINVPEHHAPIMPTAYAILPERALHLSPLHVVPWQSPEPQSEGVVVIVAHQLLHPLALHRQWWQWWRYRSWWRWSPVERDVIDIVAILFAKVADGIGEGHMLRVHKELHGTALCVAYEAAIGVAVVRF